MTGFSGSAWEADTGDLAVTRAKLLAYLVCSEY
jgi:hypothetical protein